MIAATRNQTRAELAAALAVLLASCNAPVSQADCAALQTAVNQSLDQVMATYEQAEVAYSPGTEQQVAQIYADTSLQIDALQPENSSLQAVQLDLAEAFQKAADIRAEAAALMPTDPRALPSPDTEQQIVALQTASEADIPPAVQSLNELCQ